jgi:chorismate dehydratase
MLIIGKVPYLNVEPFYALWNDAEFASITLTPKRLGELAEGGELDACVMSIYDYNRLSNNFEPIGDFGIAVRGPVKSVLLYLKGSIDSLEEGKIGITPETSTAFRLLRLLLEVKYGVHPREYVQGNQDGIDGRLVIGNEALLGDGAGYPFVLDLAEEWWDWKKLPFVFARWVMRKSLPVDRKWALWDFLKKSYEEGMENLDVIAKRFTGDLGETIHLKNYLENFIYQIGPEEEQGEKEFKKLIKEHGF